MANEYTVGPGGGFDFTTISAAVAAASDFDTIRVAPGTYTEQVAVTKRIQLLGAQAGVDARTRNGPESIVTNVSFQNGIFNVSNAPRVVIDGFTIQGNTDGQGISITGTGSGYWILNNIIQGNEVGMYLSTSGELFTQIRQNWFDANNAAGPAVTGTAIYKELAGDNIYIDSNRFTNHNLASINMALTNNLIISRNQILNDNTIVLINTETVKITQNTIIDTGGSVIFFGGGTNYTDIELNVIQQGTSGINVTNFITGTPNMNIRAKNNSIDGNSTAGLNIPVGGYDTTGGNQPLDATNNWWGDASGPTGTDVIDPGGFAITTPFLTQDPFIIPPGIGVLTEITREASSSSTTVVAMTKTAAKDAALGITPSIFAQNIGNLPLVWPELMDYSPTNATLTGNPEIIWEDSSAAPGELRFFAQAFEVEDISAHIMVSSVFADNAHRLYVEEYDALGNLVQEISPVGGLVDGPMVPTTVETAPYNWQKLRLYSKVFYPSGVGNFVVITVEALNYNSDGPINPAGVSFVADVYRASLS